MKKKRGRPTKYDEKKTIKKSKRYIKTWDSEENKKKGIVIPSLVSLALYLKVNTETVQEWRKRYPEFSAICREVLDIQHMVLTNGGIRGHMNSTITKLMLTKHGYSDRQENINTNLEMTHEEALEKLK